MTGQKPTLEQLQAAGIFPILLIRWRPVKIVMAILFLCSSANHIASVFTKSGIPEPAAEHWLFALVVSPLMIFAMFMNSRVGFLLHTRDSIFIAFTIAQIVEHFGWILWLGDSATIAQSIQNIVAITFAIVLYIMNKVSVLD